MRTARHTAVGLALLTLLLGCGVSNTRTTPATVQAQQSAPAAPAVQLPNRDGSLRFGVLGDFGTGDRDQYQLGEQMAKLRARWKYDMVVTVGDNIYGSERPQDFIRKFEAPYKALLDGGVKFYASLGNHDAREQRFYKLFNMDGKFYYSFKGPDQDVRFFALESGYMNADHLKWLENELRDSKERWKIPYFHHPIYSSGGRHGSDIGLRETLEPLFIKYGVSIVLQGHDHFYERMKPQNGIVYFVVGSGGKLRRGNINERTGLTEAGYDSDLAFMGAEIIDDQMYFNTINRAGQIIDSGIIERRK